MLDIVAYASAGVVAVTGIVSRASWLLCLKTKEFTSVSNKIEADALVKELSTNDHCWSTSVYNSQLAIWVPTQVITTRFCASLSVVTSEKDPHVQTFKVTVRTCCCMPWAPVHERLRPPAALKSLDEAGLPLTLDHLVQGCASLDWPDWSIQQKAAHAPNTTEKELEQADGIAHRAHAQLHSNGSAVILVRGEPMTGKTSAGIRLAQILNAVVCTRFNPTVAGHMLSQLIRARNEHNPDAWLIVFMDEVDVTLDSLGSIVPNNTLVTEVMKKNSWTQYMDEVAKLHRVIFWLTTNADDAKIAAYDPALLREKRVTAHYHATGMNAFHAVHERLIHELVPPTEMGMDRSEDIKTPLLSAEH